MSISCREGNNFIWTMLGCMYAISGDALLAGAAVVVMMLTERMFDNEVR